MCIILSDCLLICFPVSLFAYLSVTSLLRTVCTVSISFFISILVLPGERITMLLVFKNVKQYCSTIQVSLRFKAGFFLKTTLSVCPYVCQSVLVSFLACLYIRIRVLKKLYFTAPTTLIVVFASSYLNEFFCQFLFLSV